VLFLAAFACAAVAQEPKRPSPLKPGPEFQSPDVRALQADDFANPGMLWVARGGELWRAPGANGKRCADCHGADAASMKGVAARHPRHDPSLGRLTDLAGRIEALETEQKTLADLMAGSDLYTRTPERIAEVHARHAQIEEELLELLERWESLGNR